MNEPSSKEKNGFYEILEDMRKDLARIGFRVGDRVGAFEEVSIDDLRTTLLTLSIRDCERMNFADLICAWMAKHKAIVADWIGFLAQQPTADAQYLVALFEVANGWQFPLPEGKALKWDTAYATDDSVFDFHPVDSSLARRGFLAPRIVPAFRKVS